MAKTTIKEKRSAAKNDNSHNYQETTGALAKNILIVVMITLVVWANVVLLVTGVSFSLTYLNLGHNQAITLSHFLILLVVMVVTALFRAFLIQYSHWTLEEGDGSTTSVSYFYDTYYDNNPDKLAVKHRYESPTFLRSLKRTFMTYLTIGSGGSGGLEGPVLPIGEAIGAGFSKLFKINNKDNLRMFQMAGISCAVTTLLHAPFTASVFAAEIVFGDRLTYRPLMYSLIASLIAFELSDTFTHVEPLFTLETASYYSYSWLEYTCVVLVAIFISAPSGLAVTIVFNYLDYKFDKIPLIIRAPIGAMCALLIAFLVWLFLDIEPSYVLGIGEHVIHTVVNNDADPYLSVWWILLLLVLAKTFATGFTLLAGGSAGLLVPAMFIGGLSGAAVYHLITLLDIIPLHSGHTIFVITGISSALVAVIEVPLSAMILVLEVFGSHFGPPAILAVLVTHKVVKQYKFYKATNP